MEGKDPVNRFNHASGVAFVTQNDSPQLVRIRCVIEVLVAFLCFHFAYLNFLLV